MAKEIDLIMFPALAPAALKTAVDAHKVTYNAFVKARTKLADAKLELDAAEKALNLTTVNYQAELNKWVVK